MTNYAYSEFCEAVKERSAKGKTTKFPKYCKNLSYDALGIYSFGSRIADLNLDCRVIRKLGYCYWSKTSEKHYNYAKHILEICYDFYEVDAENIHVHHFDPWMHT